MKHRAALLLSPLAALVAATGCVEDNRRLTLGDDVRLDTFSDLPPEPERPQASATLDRSSWGRQQFLVPVDGTAARPTWRTHPESATDKTHRQRGEYPTAETAVLTEEPYSQAEWQDAGRSAVVNTVDLALMPGRWFIYPATDEAYSPIETYDRAPWNESPAPPITGRPVSAGPPPEPAERLPVPGTMPQNPPPLVIPMPDAQRSPDPTPPATDLRIPPAPSPSPPQQIPPAYRPPR